MFSSLSETVTLLFSTPIALPLAKVNMMDIPLVEMLPTRGADHRLSAHVDTPADGFALSAGTGLRYRWKVTKETCPRRAALSVDDDGSLPKLSGRVSASLTGFYQDWFIKVAIITGASSGIGRHAAIALSAAGWWLALTARRLPELQETKAACAHPERCLVVEGDITDEAFVKHLFEQTIEQFERLDLLFNNAGRGDEAHPIEEMPLAMFSSVLDVNLVGSFLCTREAFKIFKAQTPTGGRIINNGSIAAHVPRPNSVAYACSKHAVLGLTKSSALEGRAFDVSVTQIDIGNAHTRMASPLTVGALQPDGRHVAEPSFDPVHVGETIVHIASLPNSVTMLQVNIMATGMPYVGRG